MVRVKCINPACTAPGRTFEWDESRHAAGGIAQPHEPGAVRKLAACPYCGQENYVWVKKASKPHRVVRGSRRI